MLAWHPLVESARRAMAPCEKANFAVNPHQGLPTSVMPPSQTPLPPSQGTSVPSASQWAVGEIIAFVTLIVTIILALSGWILKRSYERDCKFFMSIVEVQL